MLGSRLKIWLLKPLVIFPSQRGASLRDRMSEIKRQQEENKRQVTERELKLLNQKIDRLLSRLDHHEPEPAETEDEECIICFSGKASIVTQPCGHRVVCRRCFIKTIQAAISQRSLPLCCIVCRAHVHKLVMTNALTTGNFMSAPFSQVSQTPPCLMMSQPQALLPKSQTVLSPVVPKKKKKTTIPFFSFLRRLKNKHSRRRGTS